MEISRRDALAGAAAVAAAPLLAATPGRAAAPVADKQAPSFYRYKVGDIQVTVVSDGRFTFPLQDSFITNAKKEEVNAVLENAFLPRDIFTIYFAPLVINTGGKLPHRPCERPVGSRRHAGVPERRGAGAGDRVEVLDG
jgi:TAT (twin-arginine translocation) pathway signal sequence